MKNKNEIPVMDERQEKIASKAWNITGAFLALCMVIALICNIVRKGEPGWELFALVGACLVFILANRKLGDIQPPKSWCGKALPTGDSPEERAQRRKSYCISSLILAGTFGIMDVVMIVFGKKVADMEVVLKLFPTMNLPMIALITGILCFVVMFIVSFSVEYLYHEKYELKAFRKMIARLDDEE